MTENTPSDAMVEAMTDEAKAARGLEVRKIGEGE